jgi:CubicO group peptidase (beta-lactamase class C family)
VLLRTHADREFLTAGTANVKTGRRPTAHDHYRIASMAKSFNGAVVLALVDHGLLSLDDTVGGWIGFVAFTPATTQGRGESSVSEVEFLRPRVC